MSAFTRSTSRTAMSTRLLASASAPGSRFSISTAPEMLASGLRISCAMLAARRPMPARCSARATACSMERRSVRSWKWMTRPITFPAWSDSGVADRPKRRFSPSGRTASTSSRVDPPERARVREQLVEGGYLVGQMLADGGFGQAKNLAGRVVHGGDGAVESRGQEPRRQAANGVLMERCEVAHHPLMLDQALAHLAPLPGQASGQRADGHQPGEEHDEAEDEILEGEIPGKNRLAGQRRQYLQVSEKRDADVEEGRSHRDTGGAKTLGQRDDGDDIDEVEEGVAALRPTRGMDQQRDEDQVDADLNVGEAYRILDPPETDRVGQAGEVGGGHEAEDKTAEGARQGFERADRHGQDHDRQHEHRGQPGSHQHQVGDDAQRLQAWTILQGQGRGLAHHRQRRCAGRTEPRPRARRFGGRGLLARRLRCAACRHVTHQGHTAAAASS